MIADGAASALSAGESGTESLGDGDEIEVQCERRVCVWVLFDMKAR